MDLGLAVEFEAQPQLAVGWDRARHIEVAVHVGRVFDVELGLTNLKYFDYMKKLGVLLYKKKKFEKRIKNISRNGLGFVDRLRGHNQDYFKQQIAEVQKQAK